MDAENWVVNIKFLIYDADRGTTIASPNIRLEGPRRAVRYMDVRGLSDLLTRTLGDALWEAWERTNTDAEEP